MSIPQLGKNPLRDGFIKLPVMGLVKLRQSRTIPDDGIVKQARVVKRVSGWYVMLTVQWLVNPPQPMPHGHAIGIDVGLISMVATSDGLLVKRPRFFVNAECKLKLLRQKAESWRCRFPSRQTFQESGVDSPPALLPRKSALVENGLGQRTGKKP